MATQKIDIHQTACYLYLRQIKLFYQTALLVERTTSPYLELFNSLKEIAEKIVSENLTAVEEYKKGKEASLQFLVGQGMKASKGSANPEALRASLLDALSKVS